MKVKIFYFFGIKQMKKSFFKIQLLCALCIAYYGHASDEESTDLMVGSPVRLEEGKNPDNALSETEENSEDLQQEEGRPKKRRRLSNDDLSSEVIQAEIAEALETTSNDEFIIPYSSISTLTKDDIHVHYNSIIPFKNLLPLNIMIKVFPLSPFQLLATDSKSSNNLKGILSKNGIGSREKRLILALSHAKEKEEREKTIQNALTLIKISDKNQPTFIQFLKNIQYLSDNFQRDFFKEIYEEYKDGRKNDKEIRERIATETQNRKMARNRHEPGIPHNSHSTPSTSTSSTPSLPNGDSSYQLNGISLRPPTPIWVGSAYTTDDKSSSMIHVPSTLPEPMPSIPSAPEATPNHVSSPSTQPKGRLRIKFGVKKPADSSSSSTSTHKSSPDSVSNGPTPFAQDAPSDMPTPMEIETESSSQLNNEFSMPQPSSSQINHSETSLAQPKLAQTYFLKYPYLKPEICCHLLRQENLESEDNLDEVLAFYKENEFIESTSDEIHWNKVFSYWFQFQNEENAALMLLQSLLLDPSTSIQGPKLLINLYTGLLEVMKTQQMTLFYHQLMKDQLELQQWKQFGKEKKFQINLTSQDEIHVPSTILNGASTGDGPSSTSVIKEQFLKTPYFPTTLLCMKVKEQDPEIEFDDIEQFYSNHELVDPQNNIHWNRVFHFWFQNQINEQDRQEMIEKIIVERKNFILSGNDLSSLYEGLQNAIKHHWSTAAFYTQIIKSTLELQKWRNLGKSKGIPKIDNYDKQKIST